MLMQTLLNYIQLNGQATLLDLSRHFKVSESAIEAMLAIWIRKGKIKYLDLNQTASCASNESAKKQRCTDCSGCDSRLSKIYSWVN